MYACMCVYVFTYHTSTYGSAIRRAILFQYTNLITAIGSLRTYTFKTTERESGKIERTRVNEEKKHNPEMRERGGREVILCVAQAKINVGYSMYILYKFSSYLEENIPCLCARKANQLTFCRRTISVYSKDHINKETGCMCKIKIYCTL